MADKNSTGVVKVVPGSPEAALFKEVSARASSRILEAIVEIHRALQAEHGSIALQAVLDGVAFAFGEWGRFYMVACAKAGVAETAHKNWHGIAGSALSYACERAAEDLATPLH